LRELGVNWTVSDLYFKKGGTTRATLSNLGLTPGVVGDMTAGDAKRPTPTVAGTLAYQGVLTSPMFEVMLQALEQSGKAQTLSVPRVTTLNNQPAKIWEGREFRYFERFTTIDVVTSVTDNRENRASRLVPTGQPSREELGYKLEVTPSVGADRQTIILSLAPEISDLADWVFYESADVETSINNRTTNTLGMVKLPIFIKRQIVTKVAVRSGDTVVMGGLINSTDQKDVRRVPLLGSLPLLGALFRYEVVNKVQRNLLIFVTARVLAETGEELVAVEGMGEGGGGS
jgi:general secretion pathway protein D